MAASIPWAVRFRRPARLHERVADVVERVMLLSMRRRGWVLVLTLLTTAWAVYGTRQIVVDTASFEFLPPDQEARVDAAAIEEAIGPFFPLELTLQPETTGAWRSATYLLDLAGVQRELESLPAIGRTTTAGDVLREVHVAVTGEDRERLWRPDEDDDVDNLLDLIGRTGHDGTLRNWVTEDDRVLRLTATTPMATAREFQMLSENVRRTVERGMGADTRVSLGGYLPLYSRIVEHTLDDQIASFTLAFLLVFAILAVVLGSWRYLLVAMPANLLPVGIVLGTMGTAGIRLDLATVTVAAVVLGIIVDDSVHILYRLRRELIEGRPLEDAVRDVARGSGVAIVSTSFVFAAGFLVIAFATSDAVALPGLLTAVAVVAALLSDLIVLPAFATFVFGWARTTGAAAPVARPRRTAAETR
jgi:predicted RND superfamily exporter protein